MPGMVTPLQALQAARAPSASAGSAAPVTKRGVIVVGGGGPLGSAVLEHLLGAGRWAPVVVLISQPLAVALRGLEAWSADCLTDPSPTADSSGTPDTAVLVLDREQSRHRREAALYRPLPADLPAVARGLLALGVQRLVVVLPHAPGLLPQALRAGLASLDEQAVAALGFHQLVMVRPAHLSTTANDLGPGAASGWSGLGQRVAKLVLAQLRFMVPQREQALRATKVAQFVGELAWGLPRLAAGTRVVAPEVLWDWAQPGGADAVMQAWLAGPGGDAGGNDPAVAWPNHLGR